MRKLYLPLSLLLLSILVFAEGTRTWEQSKFDDLEKGTAKGVAMRSEGGLELAPSLKPIYTTPSTYIWAIAGDAQGNIYAAAGAPARVYRVTPSGQTSIIFQPQELQVQALVVDAERSDLRRYLAGRQGVQDRARRGARGARRAPKRTPPNAPQQRQGETTGGRRATPLRCSSIRRPSTSGTSPRTRKGASMSPPATRGEIFRVEKNGRAFAVFQKRRGPHPRAAFRSARQPDCRLRRQRAGLPHLARPARRSCSIARRKKRSPRWPSTRPATSMPPGVGEKRGGPRRSRHDAGNRRNAAPTITVTTGAPGGRDADVPQRRCR